MNSSYTINSLRPSSDTPTFDNLSLIDREDRFSRLLREALEQQHSGSLERLLGTDDALKMIGLVGRQYSHASQPQKDIIDRWLNKLTSEQQLHFFEENDVADHVTFLHRMLTAQCDDAVKNILDDIRSSNKGARYFEEVGKQRSNATDEQKKLIDAWQKTLSAPQEEAYLKGTRPLPVAVLIPRLVPPFVDKETLLCLRSTNKKTRDEIALNHPGRMIAIEASQLHKYPWQTRQEMFQRQLLFTKILVDPHQKMKALEGFTHPTDAKSKPCMSEFEPLKLEMLTLKPDMWKGPLTALASRLRPLARKEHAAVFKAIHRIPSSKDRIAPLNAVIRAPTELLATRDHTTNLALAKTFLSVDVEDLSYPDLRAWVSLLGTYFSDDRSWLGTNRQLLEKTQAAIGQLPEDQRQSLQAMLRDMRP